MRPVSTTNTCPINSILNRASRWDVIAALRKIGYTVDVSTRHWSNGECIAVDPKTGELEGGQDHRSHYGKAAGY